MFHSDVWGNVPDGSRLRVALDAGGVIGVDGTRSLTRRNAPPLEGSLSSGDFPISIEIRRGEQHTLRFDACFAGVPVDVAVVADVERPDGGLHGVRSIGRAHLTELAKVFTVSFVAVGEP